MNRGGVETWLMHLLRNIDRSRFKMDFLTHADAPGDYDEEIRSLGSQILSCCHPANLLRHRREFRDILTLHGPYDVVHSHDPNWDGVAMSISSKMGVTVRIIHCHTDIERYLPENLVKRLYLRYSMKRANLYATNGLACSKISAASYFGSRWEGDNRRRVYYCGEDFSPFHLRVDPATVRKGLGFPHDAIVLGNVGSFRNEHKNHAFILQITRELSRIDNRFRVLLVGEGPLRCKFEQQAFELGIAEIVQFTGSRDDVPQLMLGAMDLFLFPSRYEGLPLVAIEAQAAGLPCIFSRAVPQEAVVVPELVKYVSLESPPAEWARIIIEHLNSNRSFNRDEALDRVEGSAFNIRTGMTALERTYEGLEENREP
jgi:glycosyltransferase involved in cell wall biosynthesis